MDANKKETIKEELKDLADAAKKVGETAIAIGSEELEVVKEKAKPAAEKAKKAAAKGTAKIKDLFKSTKVHSFIQIDGQEISEDEIIEKIKDAYKQEGGDNVVKELNIYIKPYENAVYYVVNGVSAGKVDIN